MKNTTGESIIEVLRLMLARFELPDTVVSDNEANWASEKLNDYFRINGIHHVFSPPYYPASNGLSESSVEFLKNSIKKAYLEKIDPTTTL